MLKLITFTIVFAVVVTGGYFGCKSSKVAMEKNISAIELLMNDIDNGK